VETGDDARTGLVLGISAAVPKSYLRAVCFREGDSEEAKYGQFGQGSGGGGKKFCWKGK